jgi:hypothetical protein
MLLGLSQSIATLLTIILFYAMDFTGISRDDQKKISQQLNSSFKFQIHHGA